MFWQAIQAMIPTAISAASVAVGGIVSPPGVPPLEARHYWAIGVLVWDGAWIPVECGSHPWCAKSGHAFFDDCSRAFFSAADVFADNWTRYAAQLQWDFQDAGFWTLRQAKQLPCEYQQWDAWAYKNYGSDAMSLWGESIGYQIGGPIGEQGQGYGYAPAHYNGRDYPPTMAQINNRIKAQTATI